MAKIIIIRHGETIEGLNNILLGQLDGSLSSGGRKEMKNIASYLKEFGIKKVISSNLSRALETAKIISDELGVADIEIEKSIRERSAGIYEGKSEDDVDWDKYEQVELAHRKHQDGESFSEVEERIRPFLDELLKSKENTLIITHSVVMHMMIKILKDISFEQALNVDLEDRFIVFDLEGGNLNRSIFPHK